MLGLLSAGQACATTAAVVVGPVVAGFSPGNGAVGTPVVITGSGFTGATAVLFGGVSAPGFTVNSDTQITTAVPAGAASNPIGVRVGGTTSYSPFSFVVSTPAPTISSFTPTSGPVTRTTVTLSGTNLQNTSVITFAAAAGSSNNRVTSGYNVNAAGTEITNIVVPGGAATGAISVTTPGGTATSASSFTVLVAPLVSNVTPSRAPVGATVTISGFEFTGATSVLFGFTPASFTVLNDLRIAAVVPAGLTPGPSIPVTVVTPAGRSTLSDWFAVVPNTTVSSFTPSAGPAGTTVTISGTNFTGATAVRFNGTVAPGFSVNAAGDALTVAVPGGATTGPISVTDATGFVATSANSFVVASTQPSLVVSAPLSVSGRYNNVTVTGTGQLALAGNLTVEGALVVQNGGTLDDWGYAVTGPGRFTLAAGSTLIIRSAQGLRNDSSGTVRVTGGRRCSPAASFVYRGSTAQVTGTGLPTRVRNLTIDNPSGVALSQVLAVRGVLEVAGAGNLALNGQGLGLISDADSTASVLNTGSGVVSGPVTVQRYVGSTVNPGLGYRHLAAPVANTTFADLAAPSFTPVVNPAYNAAPNPGAVTPFPTVFGYDEARLNISPATTLSAFDKGWFSPASLTEPMPVGRAYTVNLAGGRVVDFVGTLNNGDVTLTLPRTNAPDGGWHLLGNPYPSGLDWSLVTIPAGLDAAMYTFQSATQYAGTYRSYTNGIGNPYLALGQGFFVRTSAGSTAATLTLRNQARTALPHSAAMLNRTATETRPLLHLHLRTAAGLTDEAYVYFQAGATAGYDAAYDAYKLPNPSGLDLAAVAGGTALSISGLPLLPTPTVVPLQLRVPQAGTYTLQAAQLLNFPAADVYLLDAQTGQRLDLAQHPSYAFSTGALVDPGRFALEFAPRRATAARRGALAAGLSLYPNPARGRCVVQVPAVAGARKVEAVVYNALGQPVRRQSAAHSPGGTALTLDLTSLPAGVYSVRVQAGPDAVTKRIVVQ